MVIIPAIDIFNGECVRLYQGKYSDATVYNADPVDTARKFEELGALRIHIVDLNAARGDREANREQIFAVRKAVSCMIEVGGGIREEKDVQRLADAGIDRMVVGTAFARDPDMISTWIMKFGRRFIAGIDALAGSARTEGWEENSGVSDIALAEKARHIGMCSIIYTNIAKDGTLEGPDIERTQAVAQAAGIPVILSGGISSLDDIKAAAEKESFGISACITGKAVYEGRIDLKEAFSLYQTSPEGGMPW